MAKKPGLLILLSLPAELQLKVLSKLPLRRQLQLAHCYSDIRAALAQMQPGLWSRVLLRLSFNCGCCCCRNQTAAIMQQRASKNKWALDVDCSSDTIDEYMLSEVKEGRVRARRRRRCFQQVEPRRTHV